MTPVSRAHVEEVRAIVSQVLSGATSKSFLERVDAVLNEWAGGKLNATQACDKVQKMVALFIDEKKALEIASRCAPIVMKETASRS